uniref:Uncharacterized protein n=1 Tax=Ascaris lumbricoides TaxID=6252 RepID=A0A0M3I1W6_ASCLU
MGNTDIARESSSCSSDSPPPLSTEDDSLSSPPHNATHLSSSEKDASKSAITKAVARSSAVKRHLAIGEKLRKLRFRMRGCFKHSTLELTLKHKADGKVMNSLNEKVASKMDRLKLPIRPSGSDLWSDLWPITVGCLITAKLKLPIRPSGSDLWSDLWPVTVGCLITARVPMNNSSGSMENVAKSPFKQTLAEWGNTSRHREELLSPEIRRRSEFPNSTRLRNSVANLNSEESGDERASPVSPFIQRFNAKVIWSVHNAENKHDAPSLLVATLVVSRIETMDTCIISIARFIRDFPKNVLRNSVANLNSEESGDERASPVSPFIQRFNAKTSQYRSFNLKKTSERNQEVLDQLAQLRAQLKQKQQQMERSFAASNGSSLVRSRTSGTMGAVSGKSGEAVAAV